MITEALTQAFQAAVTSIQADVVSMLTLALPSGLAIFGVGFVIRKGVNFFQSLAS